MNAALLQQHLSGNSDALFRILETLEFQHINLNNAKTQFRFSRLEDSNPTSMMLDVNTLRYYCFSTNGKGNLFTLIMDRIHCTFPQSLQFVANILDLDTSDFNVQVTYPFHGFYRKLLPDRDDDFTLPTIPETTLDPYLGKYNTMFFQDGIDYKTQELFQVGYDEESSRITIPERDFNGNLVGIMGRRQSIGEAYHITSDEALTWDEIAVEIGAAVGVKPKLVHISSDQIIRFMPDQEGNLLGDKATGALMDNSKIKRAVPDFVCTTSFAQGVRQSVAYFRAHPEIQTIDEAWNKAIDALVEADAKFHP